MLNFHYTFSREALIIFGSCGVIILGNVWIWKKVVKLLIMFWEYWREVLMGNDSSSNLKPFVELKAIYFRRYFHIGSLLNAPIQFWIKFLKNNLLVSCFPVFLEFLKYTGKPYACVPDYHSYNFLSETMTGIWIPKSTSVTWVQTWINLFQESLDHCCQQRCCNKWKCLDLKRQ